MKYTFIIVILLLVLFSCRKGAINNPDTAHYLEQVNANLKDSLSVTDFQSLDVNKSVLSKVDSEQLFLLRIPFRGKSIANDFILVKTDNLGNVERGKIIHLEGGSIEYGEGRIKGRKWNGNIEIISLNRNESIHSAITNGYIEAFHPTVYLRTNILELPGVMPEVVVIAHVHYGGISYSDWIGLQGLFGIGGFSGYYDPINGNDGTYGTIVGGGQPDPDPYSYSGSGTTPVGGGPFGGSAPIQIDFEDQYNNPAIDIEKYMKCFADIPDAGAAGSIEILTDIPVNGDPTKFFDWSNGSPGHAFIKLRKENGNQSVQQIIGFYPVNGWKTVISPAPIAGKFVDNQQHELNASYMVNLTAAQVQTAVTTILSLSHWVKYDIDEYNCTDWALDVFNNAVGYQRKLEIQKYDIPGGEAPFGTSTPNGLFIKLRQMKAAGGPEAANIEVPLIGWVGPSHGACN